jgi:hypothetical protein
MAHWCQAMAHFELGGCVKKWHLDAKSGQKLTLVSMFDSISIAVRLFHIIHIPPRNVVWVAQEHLMVYWCQAVAHFELGCVKKWHLNAKSGQNLTLFQCLTG